MSKAEQTIKQRYKNLIELIRDSKELAFNPVLIRDYERQLIEVEQEIQRENFDKVLFHYRN